MYYFRQLYGLLLAICGLFMFLYGAYDFLWRIACMIIGLILIVRGVALYGFSPFRFRGWSNGFRF